MALILPGTAQVHKGGGVKLGALGALRPEFDREFSFSRMNVPDNGEIDFVSECDERIFKKDRMREIWDAQRQQVREQAKLLFDEEAMGAAK